MGAAPGPGRFSGDDPNSLQRSAPLRSRQTVSQQVSRHRPQVTPRLPPTPSPEELWRRGNKGGLHFNVNQQTANSLILSCHARASEKPPTPPPAALVPRRVDQQTDPQAQQPEMARETSQLGTGLGGGSATPAPMLTEEQGRNPTPPERPTHLPTPVPAPEVSRADASPQPQPPQHEAREVPQPDPAPQPWAERLKSEVFGLLPSAFRASITLRRR